MQALLLFSFLSDNGLDPGDVLANLFDPACVIQLVCSILESQIEKFFLGSYQFSLKLCS